MYQREMMVCVRALAIAVDLEGGPGALPDASFDALDLADTLVNSGHDPVHSLAVLSALEAERLVTVVERAGQEGAVRTAFVLTQKGYATGNPERHAGGMRGSLGLVSKRAALFSACVLGVAGGPLALAGLLEPVVEWHGSVAPMVWFWWERVTEPLQNLLWAIANAIGFGHVSPAALKATVEYLTLGILLDAAVRNADRVQREATFLGDEIDRGSLLQRGVRWIVTFTIRVALWPLLLVWEVLFTAIAAYAYAKKRDELDPGFLFRLPPRALLARFITLMVPMLIFLGLFLANLLQGH